eukprot:13997284-Alexandrium_andersonii.AAC.1
MDYLVSLLDLPPQEGQGGQCGLAGSVPEGTPDFARALFAAGAIPGEAWASVAEVFSPPRVIAMAERRPRLGVLPVGAFDLRPGPGVCLGISTDPRIVSG